MTPARNKDSPVKEVDMQKLLTSCGLLVSLSLLAGCAATTPGLGDEAGSTSLPSGMALLDSDEGECDGTVHVGEAMIEDEGEGLEASSFVEPGEDATFELEAGIEEVEWACVGGDSPEVESMRCPRGATHVRITRAVAGGELLFECYG
jgi:hypothetical protein